MDKHKLNEILKNLPDSFRFKAVFEESQYKSISNAENQKIQQNIHIKFQDKQRAIVIETRQYNITKTIDGKYCPKNKNELKVLCDIESICLGDIDTRKVTNMSEIFEYSNRKNFRGIECWKVSQVRTMRNMFCGANNFNQSLHQWNISSRTNITGMFAYTNYPKKHIKSWREKVGEKMFKKAFIEKYKKVKNVK